MSVSNERNNPGIQKGYRNRLIRRAQAVAADPAFRHRIREVRRAWNEEFPSLRIVTFDTVTDWEQAESTLDMIEGWDFLLLPRGSADYFRDRTGPKAGMLPLLWSSRINNICVEFWPERFFPKQMNWDLRGNALHPASKFVEACLYCEVTSVAAEAERWFPPFKIHLHALPYEPTISDRWKLAVAEAERDAWRELAIEALSRLAKHALSEPQIKGFDERARRIANSRALKLGFDPLDGLQKPTKELFWYLPVSQQMSVTDVESVIRDIVEKSRTITGPNFIDDMVLELKDEGLSNDAIADLLGCSLSTVKDAVRRSRQ